MLYARASLNYQVSIRYIRRAALLAAYPMRRVGVVRSSTVLRQHLDNAEAVGLRPYLRLEAFTHRSTDGPLNPYAQVYSLRQVAMDFPDFRIIEAYSAICTHRRCRCTDFPGRGVSVGTYGSCSRPDRPRTHSGKAFHATDGGYS
jgi:hypothetical protein